jgi:sugar (pentulose or hexulose) kinase
VGAEKLYAATGQRVDGRYLLPMFARLARSEPDRAAQASMLLGAKDFLFAWLTGVRATDPSTATGYGCFDLHSGGWLPEVAGVLSELPRVAGETSGEVAAVGGLPELPPIWPSAHAVGLRAEAAAALGLAPGTPVTVGAADSVLGALGLGVVRPGEVAYLAGTSTVILGISARPTVDPAMRYLITPMADGLGWGLEMDLLSTGSSLRWLATLTGSSVAELAERAAARDPRSAPQFLPYLAPGEQGALWDPRLAGTVFGLALHHDAVDLARGLQSGVVLESRRCIEVLSSITAERGPVHVGGGGAIQPGLAQELAAACHRPVRPGAAVTGDYSAIGAARLAGAPPTMMPEADDGIITASASAQDLWDELAERHDVALAAAQVLYGSNRHPQTLGTKDNHVR